MFSLDCHPGPYRKMISPSLLIHFKINIDYELNIYIYKMYDGRQNVRNNKDMVIF